MKTNKEKVFDFIVEYSKRFKTINDETPKLDTQFLSEKLEMRRSNLSSILNQLVDERKIEKTKGRPVLYYLSTDQEVQIENQVFDSLIGQDLSLKDTIQFTKSAIAYPMRIPRILFTGQKGTGVRTLAEKIYEYVCLQRILKKDSNFKIVDCLDYNEKQISNLATILKIQAETLPRKIPCDLQILLNLTYPHLCFPLSILGCQLSDLPKLQIFQAKMMQYLPVPSLLFVHIHHRMSLPFWN